MYRNVLLTDKEIALLKTIISQTLHEKIVPQARNLTIIHNRLRDIVPLKKYNQTINWMKSGLNPTKIKESEYYWVWNPMDREALKGMADLIYKYLENE